MVGEKAPTMVRAHPLRPRDGAGLTAPVYPPPLPIWARDSSGDGAIPAPTPQLIKPTPPEKENCKGGVG